MRNRFVYRWGPLFGLAVGGDELLDEFFDFCGRLASNELVNDFTLRITKDGGNSFYVNGAIFVHTHFGEHNSTLLFRNCLFEYRGERTTGRAPSRKKKV